MFSYLFNGIGTGEEQATKNSIRGDKMSEKKNSHLEHVLNAAMEIIIFYDDEERILGGNAFAQKELGYSQLELEVMTLNMIFQKQEDEDGREGQLVAYRRNNTCFPIRTSHSRVEAEGEEPYNIIFGRNISGEQEQRRKYQRQKEKASAAERLRQEFTSNVTHELRTPINGIKGHAQILAETDLDFDQKQHVTTILRACADMENLVNSILDYAKLEAGKFDLEKKDFSFREFIKHVEAVNRISIENKGLDFLINIDQSIPDELIGDSLRLTQILNNLISNARKFTSSGQITLEVNMTEIREKEVELFFMVIDTGIGISKNDMDKLFQPFSQVDASIARQYGGTGLGLAICKQLVENMRGTIQVSSEKGEGSNFSFSVILGCRRKLEIPDVKEEEEDQSFIMEASPAEEKKAEEKKRFKINNVGETKETEEVMIFGSKVNRREVNAHLLRIIICLEMNRFDKAEEYLDAVKKFLSNGPEDVSKLLFRMGMQVRKENYEKAYVYYEQLSELLADIWKEEK